MTDAYTTVQEWPKMLYRPAPQGGVEKRAFNSEADVPKNEGWTDSAAAKAKAKPAPVVQRVSPRDQADLRIKLATEAKNAAEASNMAARSEAAAQDARNALHAALTRVADLEGFVQLVANNANLPAPVRTAAQGVLKPPAAPEAEPRRRKLNAKLPADGAED